MQQKILWAEAQKETGRWKCRWKIRDFLVDERCSRAVLDFLIATDVRKLVPPLGESGVGSEVSEAELREWEEGQEAEEVGARGGITLFLPTPDFMAFAGVGRFYLSSLCHFLSSLYIFVGKAWVEHKGELATCRHRADSGQETDCTQSRHDLDRSHASSD